MKVYWTVYARQRLREIKTYLDDKAPAVTQKTITSIVKRSQTLGALPKIGRQVPEYRRADIRQVLERPYRLVYRIVEDKERIDVLTVAHYQQLLPGDMKALLELAKE